MRLLVMLALVFAPVSMMSGFAATAHPAMAAAESHHDQSGGQAKHCAEMSGETQDKDGSFPQGDCLTDCAVACSAIPALGSLSLDGTLALGVMQPRPLVDRLHGLNPESADPPPRFA